MDEAELAKNLMLNRKCENCAIIRQIYFDHISDMPHIDEHLLKAGCQGTFKPNSTKSQFDFYGPREGACKNWKSQEG